MKTQFLAAAAILLILFSACSDDDKKNPVSDNNDEEIVTDFRFPYNPGYSWTYDAEMLQVSDDNPDSLEASRLRVTWTVANIAVMSDVETFTLIGENLVTSGPHKGRSFDNTVYYAAREDTLQSVLREGSNPWGTVFHKAASPLDTDKLSSWEVNVLIYPLEVGKEWIFARNDPNYGTKKIVAFEEITVPAGTFHAYKTQRIISNNVFTIWYSKEGVVRKLVEIRDLTRTDENGENPLLFSMDMKLKDYILGDSVAKQ